MSKLLSVTATKVLHDEKLKTSVTQKIESIMQDGKVDTSDIPDILSIVVECTDNLGALHLSYTELIEVLEEIIMYILEQHKVIPDDKKQEFTKMIHGSIKLVLLQPKIKSCILSGWTRLKSLFCCSSSSSSSASSSSKSKLSSSEKKENKEDKENKENKEDIEDTEDIEDIKVKYSILQDKLKTLENKHTEKVEHQEEHQE
jgi:hypothetical protein